MRRLITMLISMACLTTPAVSAPASKVTDFKDSLSFMIEAPKLIGKRVRITGQVYDAGFANTFMKIAGGTVYLRPPWTEREDFRSLIPKCSGYMAEEKCTVTNDVLQNPSRSPCFRKSLPINRVRLADTGGRRGDHQEGPSDLRLVESG